MNDTMIDLNSIAPINPELAVTINPEASSLEDMFGITDKRNGELIAALGMLLEANGLNPSQLTHQERYIVSLKLATTPNELAWFAARTTAVIAERTSGFSVKPLK